MSAPARLEKALAISALACVGLIYASVFFVRPIADALRDQGLLRITVAITFLAGGGVLLALRLRSGLPGWREIVVVLLAITSLALLLDSIRVPEERFHLFEYGLLGGLIYEAARQRYLRLGGGIWPAIPALVVALLIGWGEEGLQWLAPNRYYDLADVVLNAVAALLAVATLWALRRARRADAAASR